MERYTHTHVKDCFKDEDTIYFVVAPGELGKAIGKGGEKIKRVQQEFGKKVKVVEYRDTAAGFVRNLIYPLTVQEILEVGDSVLIKDGSKSKKSMIIGRGGRSLHLINRAVQRFFNKEVKVV